MRRTASLLCILACAVPGAAQDPDRPAQADAPAATTGAQTGEVPGGDDAPPGALDELPESQRPELELIVKPERELNVGDPLSVTLRATLPAGARISVPKQDLSPFEILDRESRVEPLDDGRERHVFELTLLAFEAQETELPALELSVVTPDQQIGKVHTEPHPIHVRSLVANEPNAEPAPATEPVVVMEDDYTLAWVAAGLLAAALLGALGYAFARYRASRPKPEAPPPPPRPPWELALQRLAELGRRQDAWIAEGRAVEYVDNVSDVTREYLGARYGFDGLESTTDEVIDELTRKRPRELPLTRVVTLLQDCDLVKFAKVEPAPELCASVHREATELVEISTPAAPPAPRAEVAP